MTFAGCFVQKNTWHKSGFVVNKWLVIFVLRWLAERFAIHHHDIKSRRNMLYLFLSKHVDQSEWWDKLPPLTCGTKSFLGISKFCPWNGILRNQPGFSWMDSFTRTQTNNWNIAAGKILIVFGDHEDGWILIEHGDISSQSFKKNNIISETWWLGSYFAF